MFDCVTVITKTARRPYLVMRLAQSIRDKKGLFYGLLMSSPKLHEIQQNLNLISPTADMIKTKDLEIEIFISGTRYHLTRKPV